MSSIMPDKRMNAAVETNGVQETSKQDSEDDDYQEHTERLNTQDLTQRDLLGQSGPIVDFDSPERNQDTAPPKREVTLDDDAKVEDLVMDGNQKALPAARQQDQDVAAVRVQGFELDYEDDSDEESYESESASEEESAPDK